MSQILWIVSFKVRVLEGCSIDFDGSEFMFGEAAGFAKSEAEFKDLFIPELEEGRFELVEVFHLSPVEQAGWISKSADKADILELLEEVKVTGEFGFGAFRSSNFLKEHR